MLHASSRATSNTLALWGLVRDRLPARWSVREIGLRNGNPGGLRRLPLHHLSPLRGAGRLLLRRVMVQEVYPAIREADAVVLLCPNYNDALLRKPDGGRQPADGPVPDRILQDKAVFALVVSGYSAATSWPARSSAP